MRNEAKVSFQVFFLCALAVVAFVGAGCGQKTETPVPSSVEVSTQPPTSSETSAPLESTNPTAGSPVTNEPATPSGDQQNGTPVTENTYKDGTYTTIGEYQSPAGAEHIGVTVTLKDDVITDVSVEGKATVATSKMMQDNFIANYKPLVVGKKITDLKLGKVSRSSLTPKGFNDALAKIEVQAK